MILAVKTGGEEAMPEWRDIFAALPLEDVRYAFVGEPPPGYLARLLNLRLIVSSGAGVDHLTRDPDLPRHVPIVKMGAPEAASRMVEYVLAATPEMEAIVDAATLARLVLPDLYDPARGS